MVLGAGANRGPKSGPRLPETWPPNGAEALGPGLVAAVLTSSDGSS